MLRRHQPAATRPRPRRRAVDVRPPSRPPHQSISHRPPCTPGRRPHQRNRPCASRSRSKPCKITTSGTAHGLHHAANWRCGRHHACRNKRSRDLSLRSRSMALTTYLPLPPMFPAPKDLLFNPAASGVPFSECTVPPLPPRGALLLCTESMAPHAEPSVRAFSRRPIAGLETRNQPTRSRHKCIPAI